MRAYLEIWDVASDTSHLVMEVDRHIEAPNFTADGQALIVNCDGRLYRVPLDDPRLIPIDTGQQDRINNDHGPSPDGQWLAFCDKSLTGQTGLFVMPLAGGTARQVVLGLPSWFHGWGPSGDGLIYAGVRGQGAQRQFAILRADLRSGAEDVLITGTGHYDGPEMTADGRWIWFNSNRSGPMALWRMRADGCGVQQMTDGTQDDWFPHPSPDGLHLCYLAYERGTEGHPFGVDVDLRLMPLAGGPSRLLRRIHGGQGCLNGPCWSPDGLRFAYVHYQ